MAKKATTVAANSLRDRLIKNSTIAETALLDDSIIYQKTDVIKTSVPMINVALSGSFDGGLLPGLTMLAGPSKHFKTAFSLLMANAFLAKYPEGIILFYDSEFGTPQSYFDSFNIPRDQVVHSPILNSETLRSDLSVQLDGLTREDNVLIIVDSMGNLASKKEVEDALEGKSVADMTRAKTFKSLWRIATPHLSMKAIPMIVVNHTYKTLEMFSKDVVGGGTGAYYSSDTIWILGRQQDAEGQGASKELLGYNFIINVEKSRYVKEKSKFSVNVSFENGILKWSGLQDIAIEFGFLTMVGKKYCLTDPATGEIAADGLSSKELLTADKFWNDLLARQDFKDRVQAEYMLTTNPLIQKESV